MQKLVDIPAKAKQAKNGKYYILKRDAEQPGFETESGIAYIGMPCDEKGKMDIDNYSCYENYYTYIRPKEESERYMQAMAKQKEQEQKKALEKKLRGNGKRHMRVALPYLVEKCLAEYGALDILNEIYGEELASKIIELAALSTVHGLNVIDYRELMWDYYGRVHHWCLTDEHVIKIFDEINKAGIHEFMRKFYQRNRTDHLAAMEIVCRVQFERVERRNSWFESYSRYDGESAADCYMLYFDSIKDIPVAMEKLVPEKFDLELLDVNTCLESDVIDTEPLMYCRYIQLEKYQKIKKFTLIPLRALAESDQFKQMRKDVVNAKPFFKLRELRAIRQPFTYKGINGYLFVIYDDREKKEVAESASSILDNLKDRLNAMGSYGFMDFDSQYLEAIGSDDFFAETIYKKNKDLTKQLKKDAGYYALFTDDETVTEQIAVSLLDSRYYFFRNFFMVTPIENYEYANIRAYEELDGRALIRFLTFLIHHWFSPIIDPLADKETDPWKQSFSSQMQRLYHPVVDLARDYAKIVEKEYLLEDDLLALFGVTHEDLEKYAYDIWLTEDYFDEEDDERWYDE